MGIQLEIKRESERSLTMLRNSVDVVQTWCEECGSFMTKEDWANPNKVCTVDNPLQYLCLKCQKEMT